MLLHNRHCTHSQRSCRLPRNSRKIPQALAGRSDRATLVAEARVPRKLLQNHLEPGAAVLDRRQLPTHLRLRPRDQRRARLRRRNPRASQHINLHLKAAFPVAKEKIMRNAKRCYLSKDMMRRVALVTLIAVGLVPSFCIAEDGSVSGEKKYSSSEAAKDQTERQTVSPRRSAATMQRRHSRLFHFRRDWYYVRANRSPWWPTAPGD